MADVDESLYSEIGVEVITEERFQIAFDCILSATEHNGEVSLNLNIDVAQEVPGIIRMSRGRIAMLTAPANVFPSRAARAEWVNKSLARLKRFLTETMVHEATLLNGDAGNYYLDFLGLDPEPTSKKELVRIHTNETEKRVAAFMGAKGQRSKWTRAELERAVTTARRSLKKPHATLDEVAEVLRRTHPLKAPASGEALGTLMRRLGVDWKGIKKPTVQED